MKQAEILTGGFTVLFSDKGLLPIERLGLFRIQPRVSLPRERFWDIPVPKIDSPTRQPLLPRP
ncbi:MAG: hypothetical protein AB2807_07050, partial [Candidatus Sedimenticola endophacoides]